MTVEVTLDELQQLLDKAAFTKLYGFKMHSVGDGECTIEVPFQPAFERPGGMVAGPVYMAAADLTMWLAIATKIGRPEVDMTLTIEMKTNFLSGAKQEAIFCKAKVLKLGRRTVYGVAECVTADGKLLTHHTLTYMRPPNAKE